MTIPETYKGREQAYIKHQILEAYLERLFMILGQKLPTINYVDCFAGPWSDESDELAGTSIAISLRIMKRCQVALKERFNRSVKFRALYIEKSPAAHARLSEYLEQPQFDSVETEHLLGQFEENLSQIIDWTNHKFTYFFVDPKGWKEISATTLSTLLQHPHCELFINFMYEFLNRAVTQTAFEDHMVEMFGIAPDVSKLDPEERQECLLRTYRDNLKSHHQAEKSWTAYTPVYRPGTQKILYHLIYLTSSPRGMQVFVEESEKLELVKHEVYVKASVNRKEERSGTADLFASDAVTPVTASKESTTNYRARSLWLSRLSSKVQFFGLEVLADMLDESDLFITDIQEAFRDLVADGLVENLSGNINRRTKNVVKFDATRGKGEQLRKISDI
ncbi:MAG: hypothetical protein DRR42_06180 [Gammaproteobacteria bacterium]|nr:MAG: hypothetical protein DRR42_06180 [Gammaproteobacteria bacterium]